MVASKKYGIMGVYDYEYVSKTNKEVFNDYGFTYLDRLDSTYFYPSKTKKLKLEAKKPYLDLSKIKFFNR